MKTHELRSLQALRQLREQRAASQLVSQQRRCQATESELDQAKERLRLHREHLARQAQQAYAALTDGLPVARWHAAQALLDELSEQQAQLQSQASEVQHCLDEEVGVREDLRLAHVSRQRQCEAWDSVIGQRRRGEQRAAEHREDADEGVALPSSASGAGR